VCARGGQKASGRKAGASSLAIVRVWEKNRKKRGILTGTRGNPIVLNGKSDERLSQASSRIETERLAGTKKERGITLKLGVSAGRRNAERGRIKKVRGTLGRKGGYRRSDASTSIVSVKK